MSDTCQTVRIKRPNVIGFVDLNSEDFDPEKHVLYGGVEGVEDRRPDNADPGIQVGGDISPVADGDAVNIPADWESLHWTKQVALALLIVGGTGPLVVAEGQTQAEKAKAIIKSELEKAHG